MISLKKIYEYILENEEEDYRGEHSAPDKQSGSPMHDLKNTYPEDFYKFDAARMYGDGQPYDSEVVFKIQSAKNRPNKLIKIYRAVPKILTPQEKINEFEKQKKYILKYGKVPPGINNFSNSSKYYEYLNSEIEKLKKQPIVLDKKIQINKGDWVTLDRNYAKLHGEGSLNNEYKILTKTVKAKDLYTDGNSIHEWGYDP